MGVIIHSKSGGQIHYATTTTAEADLPELAPGTRFTLEGHDLDKSKYCYECCPI